MRFIRSAHEAELNAAEKMREMGYTDAEAMPVGPDGGIDVKSSRAIAQVKWRGGQTGSPEIQNLFGARGANQDVDMLFFSAAGYSKSALRYADELGVMLFTYNPDGSVVPENSLAEQMAVPAAELSVDDGYVVHSEQGSFVWRGQEDSADYVARRRRQEAQVRENLRQAQIKARERGRAAREAAGTRLSPPEYILKQQKRPFP